jgi:hypothetical protein
MYFFNFSMLFAVNESFFDNIGGVAQIESVRPSCFIMYGEHSNDLPMVHKIVNLLLKAGIDVKYARNGDRGGLAFGDSIDEYMREGVLKSDYVCALYTEEFLQISLNPCSGVSVEINLLLERFSRCHSRCESNSFFIPIILSGCPIRQSQFYNSQQSAL